MKVFSGHPVFQQPVEEKSQIQDPLGFENFKKLKTLQQQI
jgi:hypothetical protein